MLYMVSLATKDETIYDKERGLKVQKTIENIVSEVTMVDLVHNKANVDDLGNSLSNQLLGTSHFHESNQVDDNDTQIGYVT